MNCYDWNKELGRSIPALAFGILYLLSGPIASAATVQEAEAAFKEGLRQIALQTKEGYEAAVQACSRAAAAYKQLNDPKSQAWSLILAATASDNLGERAESLKLYESAMAPTHD